MWMEWRAHKWQRGIKTVMHVVYSDVHRAPGAAFNLLLPVHALETRSSAGSAMESDCHRQIESRIG